MQQFDSDLITRANVVDANSAGIAVFEVDIGEEYSNPAGMFPISCGHRLTIFGLNRIHTLWCCCCNDIIG